MSNETTRDQSTFEIVVFKLRDGATHEQLIATSDPVSEWVKQQPGFIDRKLTCFARVDVASMWPLDNAHIRIDGPLPSAFRFDKDPFFDSSS